MSARRRSPPAGTASPSRSPAPALSPAPGRRSAPCIGSNFSVRFDDGKHAGIEVGFSEVVFPDFFVQRVRSGTRSRTSAAVPGRPPGETPTEHLVLRRGVTASLELYQWFDEARGARRTAPGRTAPSRTTSRRTVTVRLLAEDHATVAKTWRFSGARPVRLSYSPLRAMVAEIVIETLELAFDRVDVE